jgi:hypothetical protein
MRHESIAPNSNDEFGMKPNPLLGFRRDYLEWMKFEAQGAFLL